MWKILGQAVIVLTGVSIFLASGLIVFDVYNPSDASIAVAFVYSGFYFLHYIKEI